MSAARRIAGWLTRLWFEPDDPYPIAAFRILLAGYLLAYFGALAPHTTVLFSNEGVYAPYRVPDYAPSPALAWLAMALLLALCLALLVGLNSRLVVPLLLVAYLYHYFLALAVKHSSFERLIAIYLLALWPARADAVWSVHALLRRRRPEDTRGNAAEAERSWSFTARILRFQTIVLYLGAGLWKLGNPAWHGPYLLPSTLQSVWGTPLSFWLIRLGWSDATWSFISRSVIAGELLLAALLLVPRARPLGIALGIAFHLINTMVLAIPEFLICLTPYVFFLPPGQVERLGRALSRRSRASG